MELTVEQRAIAETAADFAREHLAPQALEWDRTKYFPTDVLRKSGELGFGGVYVKAEYGGSDLTRRDALLLFEALATGCPAIAAYISIHNMVAWMVSTYGTDPVRAKYLASLCDMNMLGAYCLTEPGAGSDAAAISTRARRSGDGWVLDGVKQFISGAGAADVYVVFARTGEPGAKGISAFVVPKETAGLSFGLNESKMGWNCHPTRQVFLESVRLPDTALLGNQGDGFSIAMRALDGGRLNIGACSIGGASAALNSAQQYLQDRYAFGQPLAEAQSLRFRVAEAHTRLRAARLLLWDAAAALEEKRRDATPLCAMAKRLATDTGFEVADAALQLHGGYGYLTETGIEKIVRDLRVHRILEGSNEIMNVIIARDLLGANG